VELRPLVEALNEAFVRIQRQIATQRRFVANAAHQLRTPLALLKTQATVGLRESETGQKDEALAAIDKTVGLIARLSSQLLSLARAEQGRASLRREDVEFSEIARGAIESLVDLALARNIDLGFEHDGRPHIVLGHAMLLRELVANLIENALRHTPIGATVTAKLSGDARDMVFSVEDNAPGIPAAERERVFERFYRLVGTEGEGTG